MSLIEEALRRVKDPLVPPASTTAKPPRKAAVPQPPAHPWPTTPPPSPVPPAAATPTALLTMVTIAILGLTAALIFGGAIWMWRTLNAGHAPVASPMIATESGSPVATNAQPRPAVSATEATPEFNLTGIVEGLGEPYAVINGSIVAVGDAVGTATLLHIGKGTVTLRLADGKERVLRVAR